MIEVVCGVIYNDKKEVLLVKKASGKYKGQWEFAGGKIQEGETPEESLVREIREELDISIEVIGLIYENKFENYRLLFYKSKHISGRITLKEHSATRWVNTNELNDFDLIEGDRCMLKVLSPSYEK